MLHHIKPTALIAALAFLAAPAGAVTLDPWTISGPDTTSVTQLGADGAAFSYDSFSSSGSPVTFTAETTVAQGGTWDYLWDFSGFHAFFKVTAFLNRVSPGASEMLVNAGPEICCTTPSASFSYNGQSSVALNTGDILRFTFGGDNEDSNETIRGTLTLKDVAPVPVAPAGIMLLSALGALAAGKRRQRRKNSV